MPATGVMRRASCLLDADPGENRKAVKAAKMDQAANSFEVVTREWYTKYSATWNASHGRTYHSPF